MAHIGGQLRETIRQKTEDKEMMREVEKETVDSKTGSEAEYMNTEDKKKGDKKTRQEKRVTETDESETMGQENKETRRHLTRKGGKRQEAKGTGSRQGENGTIYK